MKHHYRHRAVYAHALRPQGRIGCSRLPQLESLKQCEQCAHHYLHYCTQFVQRIQAMMTDIA